MLAFRRVVISRAFAPSRARGARCERRREQRAGKLAERRIVYWRQVGAADDGDAIVVEVSERSPNEIGGNSEVVVQKEDELALRLPDPHVPLQRRQRSLDE